MRVNKAITRALSLSRAGNHPAAWRTLFPHRVALSATPSLAAAWVELSVNANASFARRQELLTVIEAWPESPAIVSAAASALIDAFDGRPPDHRTTPDDPMHRVASAVEACLVGVPAQSPQSSELYHRMGCALRLSGQSRGAITALRAALAGAPEEIGWRYDLGLAYKSDARFAAALRSFEAYAAEKGADDEGLLWNLAICATGAGRGDRARDFWRAMGMTDVTLGEDRLPKVPDLGRITVRLIGPDDAPIEVDARPQSPCHGWLDAPIFASGLWDGAPVRPVQPGQPPCLPLLSIL
ncbi:MAG: tetratricopeptide (TPR) repeat protein [Myxococcota bacterium]